MSKVDSLKEQWDKLTGSIDQTVSNKWWRCLESRYGEVHRRYHNLDHLFDMFLHYDSFQSKLGNSDAVAYSIFFHDLVYDPKSAESNEEESTKLLKQFAGEANIAEDSDLYKEVARMISLTQTHLTEEHKELEIFGEEDSHYFLDFDMAILGSTPDEYDLYAEKIREEYSFLPAQTYNVLRAKIPKIFATKEFYQKFEEIARKNIQREIGRLQSSAP